MRKVTIPNFYINFLNKTAKSLSILCDFDVAPFTGAWMNAYPVVIGIGPFIVVSPEDSFLLGRG